jgi:hypothetical protein
MINSGVTISEGQWNRQDYAAGFRARLSDIPKSEDVHHCWRVGCEDANTETFELARHKQALAAGREDNYSESWNLLFDGGGDARVNGVPFDEDRTEPWKEGWIAADINMGVHGLEIA